MMPLALAQQLFSAASNAMNSASIGAAAALVARCASHGFASTSAGVQTPLARAYIPEHEVEEGLPSIQAWVREARGSLASGKLRRQGRTPGQVFSLPGNRALTLDFDAKEAARQVRSYGRNGLQARVMRLEVQAAGGGAHVATVRVLPKAVHMNSVTLALENLSFMFCPRARKVAVNVPLVLWGADRAPGVKRGGWLHQVARTVPLVAEGWAVPASLEVGVADMQVADVVRLRDVRLPPGCRLAAKDPSQPVVRCALRVGGD